MAAGERTSLLPNSSQGDTTKYALAWASPTDPKNPHNWPAGRKWRVAMLVSCYALSGAMSPAMVVPALPIMSQELRLLSESSRQLLVSLNVVGWSLGTLLFAPLSEAYGRSTVLNCGHILFIMSNSLCAMEGNGNRFLVLRFVTGLAGSAPLAIGGGTMSDMWKSEQRGRSLAIYTILPLLGPVIGAIVGGFVVQSVSWRWIFWGCSAFAACSLSVGFVFLRETFGPVILRRERTAALEDESEPEAENTRDSLILALEELVKVDLPRPFILLSTQPIIQVLALYMAYLYGLNFLTQSTYQTLWQAEYGQTVSIASLNYISVGLGFVLGCEIVAPLNDKVYAICKSRNRNLGQPEFRTYMMLPAAVLAPLGLLCYGWTAQMHLHWVLPNTGMVIYCFGLIVSFQCIQAYVLDCYPVYAASAIGALTVLRAVAGGAFPLFGPVLYRSLGYGWASTVLAGVALMIGGVAPVGLMRAGPWLRLRSRYALKEAEVEI